MMAVESDLIGPEAYGPTSADLLLGEMARLFIFENALVAEGEVVQTLWCDWKKPHRVRITRVGCHLVARYKGGTGEAARWEVGFAMNYVAHRLRKDGSSAERVPEGGICLTNLTRADGVRWELGGRWIEEYGFSHVGLTWEQAPRPAPGKPDDAAEAQP